jgi:hypothetical protein
VVFANWIGIGKGMRWKSQYGLRIARPVGSGTGQKFGKRERETTCSHCAVDQQRAVASRGFDRSGQLVFDKGTEGTERSPPERYTGSHRMTAPLV